MDAIILAAGQGTRLKPFTDTVPKPLLPLAGPGTLLRLLDELPLMVDRVIIVIGYLGEQIKQTIGARYRHVSIFYVQQSPLDGTGGALHQAKSCIQSTTFLVINGDDLYRAIDLEELCQTPHSVLVHRALASKPMDAWEIDAHGCLVRLKEAPKGQKAEINIGAYHLGKEWFHTPLRNTPGKTDEWSVPHTLATFLPTHPYQAIQASFWLPCGTPEERQYAEDTLTKTP